MSKLSYCCQPNCQEQPKFLLDQNDVQHINHKIIPANYLQQFLEGQIQKLEKLIEDQIIYINDLCQNLQNFAQICYNQTQHLQEQLQKLRKSNETYQEDDQKLLDDENKNALEIISDVIEGNFIKKNNIDKIGKYFIDINEYITQYQQRREQELQESRQQEIERRQKEIYQIKLRRNRMSTIQFISSRITQTMNWCLYSNPQNIHIFGKCATTNDASTDIRYVYLAPSVKNRQDNVKFTIVLNTQNDKMAFGYADVRQIQQWRNNTYNVNQQGIVYILKDGNLYVNHQLVSNNQFKMEKLDKIEIIYKAFENQIELINKSKYNQNIVIKDLLNQMQEFRFFAVSQNNTQYELIDNEI